jgi:Smr domain-containing protein
MAAIVTMVTMSADATAPVSQSLCRTPSMTTVCAPGLHVPRWPCGCHAPIVKLKLDLHDVYNKGDEIERALRQIIDEAVAKKAPLVEIIPGKGSGQLKKRVLRFLDQKEIKALYHRVEKDSENFGRVFVHFRWK